MASPDTTQPPLIRAGSQVFAAIAVTALLIGGLAGISQGDEARRAGPDADLAGSTADHHGDDPAAHAEGVADHGHGGDATTADDHDAAAHGHDGGPGSMASPASAGHGHGAGDHPTGSAAAAGGDHAHGAGAQHDAAHGAHPAGSPAHDADHGDGAPDAGHGHDGHDEGSGHDGHDAGMAGGDHHHATGCADDHPRTVQLVGDVQKELATTYKDIAALLALGYHPYFDSLVPGGYPPGGEGISHWINPNYIDDGVILDPQMPETILLDNWNWPIGMMFINDPGVPPVPVYVNDDGSACSPWHPHTDAPARFGWYYYRAVYDRSLEGEVPAQTPEMMHVWAVHNPAGVYAAHDYPPSEVRSGPPGPIPSYFSEVTVPGP